MRVLGISGSPRRGGNTDLLLAELLKGAATSGADVKAIVLNDLEISPCQHCDACQRAGQCRIPDDMHMVYREMEAADIIVIASPVHFSGPTAQLKAMIDRCQALWARKYILKQPPLGDRRRRRGFFISVGGTRFANLFEPSVAIIKTLFKVIDVEYAGDLLLKGVDEKGAVKQHPDALRQAFTAGQNLAQDSA